MAAAGGAAAHPFWEWLDAALEKYKIADFKAPDSRGSKTLRTLAKKGSMAFPGESKDIWTVHTHVFVEALMRFNNTDRFDITTPECILWTYFNHHDVSDSERVLRSVQFQKPRQLFIIDADELIKNKEQIASDFFVLPCEYITVLIRNSFHRDVLQYSMSPGHDLTDIQQDSELFMLKTPQDVTRIDVSTKSGELLFQAILRDRHVEAAVIWTREAFQTPYNFLRTFFPNTNLIRDFNLYPPPRPPQSSRLAPTYIIGGLSHNEQFIQQVSVGHLQGSNGYLPLYVSWAYGIHTDTDDDDRDVWSRSNIQDSACIGAVILLLGDTILKHPCDYKQKESPIVIMNKSTLFLPSFHFDKVKDWCTKNALEKATWSGLTITMKFRPFKKRIDADYHEVYHRMATSDTKKLKDVVEAVRDISGTSDDPHSSLICGVRWTSEREMTLWLLLAVSYLRPTNMLGDAIRTDHGMLRYKQTAAKNYFHKSDNLISLYKHTRSLRTECLVFVWSNKSFQWLSQHAKVSKVLTFEDVVDSVEKEDGTEDSEMLKFLEKNKKQGFYLFDTFEYDPSGLFPVRMTPAEILVWASPPGMPLSEEHQTTHIDFLYRLQHDILRKYVLHDVTNMPDVKSRWDFLCDLMNGLAFALTQIVEENYKNAYVPTRVHVPEVHRNEIEKVEKAVRLPPRTFRFAREGASGTPYELSINKSFLLFAKKSRGGLPTPLDLLPGMNVRAELCSALSDIIEDGTDVPFSVYPDILAVLFSEEHPEHIGRLKDKFEAEGPTMTKANIRVTSPETDALVTFPDGGEPSFAFCVTMHEPSMADAMKAYNAWKGKHFSADKLHLKTPYAFTRAKEADPGEGW